MRRVIGLTLAGLGAFLIVAALLLPTYISGKIVKFPLDEYMTATLTGRVSYFSPSTLTVQPGVAMRATYTIKGDRKAGTSSTAVWNEFSYVYDTTHATTYQYTTRRFAFDRRTGQLVSCCGASVNGNTAMTTGEQAAAAEAWLRERGYDQLWQDYDIAIAVARRIRGWFDDAFMIAACHPLGAMVGACHPAVKIELAG